MEYLQCADYQAEVKIGPDWEWLSGLGILMQTKRLLVQFLVRAYAWVVGQVPDWGLARDYQSMFLSVTFSLPSPLSKNK